MLVSDRAEYVQQRGWGALCFRKFVSAFLRFSPTFQFRRAETDVVYDFFSPLHMSAIGKLNALLTEDSGDDLAEYGVLLAFVFIASLALIIASGADFSRIWTTVGNIIVNDHHVVVK